MKIAQIAPLAESVPPKLYGGTERIVSYLTEALVHQGHEVTLFASGDSQTSAELVPITPAALRLTPGIVDTIPYHMMMLDAVRQRADEFDALHFHIDLLHLPMIQDFIGRTVTTLHGRLDLPDLPPFYRCFGDHCLVSISDHQRQPMPPVNWGATIYHGLPVDLLQPSLGAVRGISLSSGAFHPRKDQTAPFASQPGPASNCELPQRSMLSIGGIGKRKSRPSSNSIPIFASSARSTNSRKRIFSGVQGPCSSRSTGPSLSVL